MRIIVVEDEERSLQGLVYLITSLNPDYIVQAQARDGKKAVDLIDRLKPDLVVTDIRMPYLYGLEVIEQVRKTSKATRYIIVSAFTDFAYAKKAIQLKVSDYISKPVTVEEMGAALEKVQKEIALSESFPWEEKNKYTSEQKTEEVHPVVLKAIEIIQRQYSESVNQKELALLLRTTPEYLSYLFARDMGVSFSSYIRQYRIEMAQKLLASKQLKIYEIAELVGYKDTKYFCKIFKEVTGVSPKKYSYHLL